MTSSPASQHPSASMRLRRLASKHAMPARMWRHDIHSFLELLQLRLPASLEHMLTFLYLAYSMMALLYETVPAFQETWIECRGDLARYRMAIEDDDLEDREDWTGVSRHWYSKASDKSPTTGRLYHHLAILARPNSLQQLYYYAKSLCVPIPFFTARETVMTLFDPILDSDPRYLSTVDANFVRVHGILFSGKGDEGMFHESMNAFLTRLDGTIAGYEDPLDKKSERSDGKAKVWLNEGYLIGITTGCSLLGYGAESNVLMRAIYQPADKANIAMDGRSNAKAHPRKSFTQSLEFAIKIYEIVIHRQGDTNTLPFIHTILVFIYKMTQYPAAMSYLEKAFPWNLTASMLNYHLESCGFEPRMDRGFPRRERGEPPRPLPEDYAMRGLIYAQDYFPKHPENPAKFPKELWNSEEDLEWWFSNKEIGEGDKYFEHTGMMDQRKNRILYLGYQIADQEKWLTFDAVTQQFGDTTSQPQKKVRNKLKSFWMCGCF